MAMKTATWIGVLCGLGGLALLVAWQGLSAIAGHFGAADWAILLVGLIAIPELAFGTLSWRCLFLPGKTPALGRLAPALWMGTSVNLLLPVATIGGEVVKARYLMQRAVPGAVAVSSVFVDKTVQALSILVWTLIGLAFLLLVTEPPGHIVAGVVVGALLLTLGIAGFIAVQRARPFEALTRRALRRGRSDKWRDLVEDAAGLDEEIRALYRRKGRLVLSTLLRLCARVILAGEVWLAAWLMGLPIGFAEAVILKSLGMALRAAGFVVPGGIGLQEGAYVALGLLIGLPPDAMLSLSLASRLRELIAGVPGLLAWQLGEGRLILARRPT